MNAHLHLPRKNIDDLPVTSEPSKFAAFYKTFFDEKVGEDPKWSHGLICEEDDRYFLLSGEFHESWKRWKRKRKRTKKEKKMAFLVQEKNEAREWRDWMLEKKDDHERVEKKEEHRRKDRVLKENKKERVIQENKNRNNIEYKANKKWKSISKSSKKHGKNDKRITAARKKSRIRKTRPKSSYLPRLSKRKLQSRNMKRSQSIPKKAGSVSHEPLNKHFTSRDKYAYSPISPSQDLSPLKQSMTYSLYFQESPILSQKESSERIKSGRTSLLSTVRGWA